MQDLCKDNAIHDVTKVMYKYKNLYMHMPQFYTGDLAFDLP